MAIFKMDDQQGPTVQPRELCSVLRGSLDGRGVWGIMDTCVCMTPFPIWNQSVVPCPFLTVAS